MKNVKRVLAGLIVAATLSNVAAAQPSGGGSMPRVGVDERVELMAIIFRLAGNREYNQGKLQPYISEIERHFAPYRDHEAIKLATELREKMSVGFDTVMFLAVNMDDPYELRERVAFDAPGGILRERGLPERQIEQVAGMVRRFLVAARRFVSDSRAREFFAAHQKFYDESGARLRSMLAENADFGWFNHFYGEAPEADFFIVPLLANSETNFGPKLPGVGVRQELYAILTTSKTDSAGIPMYDKGKVGTLVHEFSHSYVNPLVESRRDQFEKPGRKIFAEVSEALSDQGYGMWQLMVIESVVRAATARYTLAHEGAKAARQEILEHQAKGYLHMPGLYQLLGEYEAQRKKYPTFASFMPRVVSYFDAVAGRIAEVKKAYDARRPKVVSLSIENGARDVDPDLTEIVVGFDRRMRASSPTLLFDLRPARGGRNRFPEITKHEFDRRGRTFRMTVRLEPEHDYELFLNRPSGGAFASTDGVALATYQIKFHTRARTK